MVAWFDELVNMISLLPAVHKNSVVLKPSDTQILCINQKHINTREVYWTGRSLSIGGHIRHCTMPVRPSVRCPINLQLFLAK